MEEVLEIDADGKVHGPVMQFQGGDWLFTDIYGDVYRLRPTHEHAPQLPLIISLERKGE